MDDFFSVPKSRYRLTWSTTVFEGFRAILYKDGRIDRVLEPGRYRLWLGAYYASHVDVRSVVRMIPGQEIAVADGNIARANLVLRYRVSDPKLYELASSDPASELHETARECLRSVVVDVPIAELAPRRADLSATIANSLKETSDRLGFALEGCEIRDIGPAGALKNAIAQVEVEKRLAQVKIERARGEMATLRSLANAARVVNGNPGLAFLRALNAAESGKASVVIGSDVFAALATPLVESTPSPPVDSTGETD